MIFDYLFLIRKDYTNETRLPAAARPKESVCILPGGGTKDPGRDEDDDEDGAERQPRKGAVMGSERASALSGSQATALSSTQFPGNPGRLPGSAWRPPHTPALPPLAAAVTCEYTEIQKEERNKRGEARSSHNIHLDGDDNSSEGQRARRGTRRSYVTVPFVHTRVKLCVLCSWIFPVSLVIQTVSAVDRDDPVQGHYFEYRLVPEMLNNPNFTIKNNQDNSISVLAKHDTFRRQKQEMYFLPIIVTDNGSPPMSSTNTLTIRVCGCSKDGVVQSCNVEAYVLPIGLSMGALIAILACIILLLVIVVLFVTLRRHKNEPLIIKDDEDVRENIIRYDDEGGGEEDTEAFDIATLQNPDGVSGYLPRKDIKPDLQFMPRAGHHSGPNGVDVDEFINVRLHEADHDATAPPYDSIQIYGYEGRGSAAGSLSSLETASSDSDQNYDYLREWGPRFRRLGELYSVGESERET
ncbi:cadherin-8-like [Entelurus aequoreus]|uniref:cadherin-8-like n=1 Tax=Entelurus aequoreus TaxID=161455 RepID=UPI002B1DE7EE|nr:cadherin-8-like [Entelurus aequoreus]